MDERCGDTQSLTAAVERSRRALLAVAAASASLFVVLFVLAVQTGWGQRLDAAAVRGRRVLSPDDIQVAARLHRTIDIASLVLLGAAIMLVALARRRPRLALGAGIIVAGSLATTEILKHVLPRPALGVVDAVRQTPSYPSGHTTIAMALSIGATFVAPRRLRPFVATAGVVFTAAVGCSLVATASHRPSDPIGAALVVTAWAALVAAVLLQPSPRAGRARPACMRVTPWMAAVGVACLGASLGGVAVVTVATHLGRVNAVGFGRAFAAAGIAIVGAVSTGTAALLFAIHDLELDRPHSPRRDQRMM